jgi:NhaA family Na+:H+ antiporter
VATDIAFSVGILVLLGSRIPKALIAFLVALAIADDLGAVLVIGLYYTADLSPAWLASAAGLVAALIALNLAGVRRIVPFFCVAAVLWYALDRSGIHASLAGVLGAFTVPTRAKYDPRLFSAHVKGLMARFDAGCHPGTEPMTNEELRAVVGTLEAGIRGVESPLRRLTDLWHVPVAFAIVPIFALVNAGVSLHAKAWEEAFASPVRLGVGLGLVIGKFVGIAGASWLALRLGCGRLPAGTRFRDIVGVSLLGGIGFTMSIFIAELAFDAHPVQLELAKLGILSASVVAGVAGVAVLLLTCRRKS